jgi:DNA-binding transcriptional MerR regulator
MNSADRSLRCGELAHLTGVSPDTIRHYERIGILSESPRTSGGYRMYGQDAVDCVGLVRRSLQLGFTLSELSEILKVRDGGGVPCHRVLRLTEEKLHCLEEHIHELRRTQCYMKQLVRQWRVKLGRAKPGSREPGAQETGSALQPVFNQPAMKRKHFTDKVSAKIGKSGALTNFG